MTADTLPELELVVLLTVARLADDAYGVRIRKEVSAIRKHDYSVGAIYTTLQRLEDKGLAESWMTEPIPVRGGRARRQFRVTALGKRAIQSTRREMDRLWSGSKIAPKPV